MFVNNSELLITYQAFVRFFPAVYPHVYQQFISSVERFIFSRAILPETRELVTWNETKIYLKIQQRNRKIFRRKATKPHLSLILRETFRCASPKSFAFHTARSNSPTCIAKLAPERNYHLRSMKSSHLVRNSRQNCPKLNTRLGSSPPDSNSLGILRGNCCCLDIQLNDRRRYLLFHSEIHVRKRFYLRVIVIFLILFYLRNSRSLTNRPEHFSRTKRTPSYP